MSKSHRILWLSWKDWRHPDSGGAEIVSREIASRLVRAGHEVIFFTAAFSGGLPEEKINGCRIVRRGNRFTVYLHAVWYYFVHLSNWPTLVIDEINTVPFFASFYVTQPNLIFIHQLTREIWFYQMFFPLNVIGYWLEPVYLWLLSSRQVVTVSSSTKNELIKFGFRPDKIKIISEGIEIVPAPQIPRKKFRRPTMLYLGTIRPMKRTDHIISAFEIAKASLPELQLIIAGQGNGRYGQAVTAQIDRSVYSGSIKYLGPVSIIRKKQLMRQSHLLVMASIKEGWGLVVTEANSQGTPAVVYNVDGLRDSVKNHRTGIICRRNNPAELAKNIIRLLRDPKKYDKLRRQAWVWSQKINFDQSFSDFRRILNQIQFSSQ